MFVFIIAAVLTFAGIKFICAVGSAVKTQRAQESAPAPAPAPRPKRALDFKW